MVNKNSISGFENIGIFFTQSLIENNWVSASNNSTTPSASVDDDVIIDGVLLSGSNAGVGNSFTFVTKTPPVPSLILEGCKIKKGSSEPNRDIVGSISISKIEEIAKVKLPDLNTKKLDSAIQMVKGTARSMGVKVEG